MDPTPATTIRNPGREGTCLAQGRAAPRRCVAGTVFAGILQSDAPSGGYNDNNDTAAKASIGEVSRCADRVDAQVREVLGQVLAQRRSAGTALACVAGLAIDETAQLKDGDDRVRGAAACRVHRAGGELRECAMRRAVV